ncbi:MAG: SAM-dependent methyltransferase [Actinoplanes sp.]
MSSHYLDTSVPDPARRYDYWLGGKDNFAADRESGDLIAARFPHIRTAVLENRRFLRRAVTTLAQSGVDQFLDIGTGFPTADNTHQIVQDINPAAKVVYVDNSPLVLVHARALLTADPDAGDVAYIDGDLRNPAGILADPTLHEHLDLTRPVGLLLIAVTHFLTDADNPHEQAKSLVDAMPDGSWLALTQLAKELLPDDVVRDFKEINKHAGIPMGHRTLRQTKAFFKGLTIAEPGILPVNRWRAENEPGPRPTDWQTAVYGGIARKGNCSAGKATR